jgi:hypothetical protein
MLKNFIIVANLSLFNLSTFGSIDLDFIIYQIGNSRLIPIEFISNLTSKMPKNKQISESQGVHKMREFHSMVKKLH